MTEPRDDTTPMPDDLEPEAPPEEPAPTGVIHVDDAEFREPHRVLLPRTTLTLTPGEVVFAIGRPGSSHTSLSLALAGRLVLSSGQVSIDGSQDRGRLQNAVALVDVPGVSEPEENVPLRTIVGEELAMAELPARADDVRRALDEAGLGGAADQSTGDVAAGPRLRLFADLASRRKGVQHVVITYPERHGLGPGDLVSVATELAARGLGVLVTASRALEIPTGITTAQIGPEEEIR